MTLRNIAAVCAVLFGLLLGYIAIALGATYGFRVDLRFGIALIALAGAWAVFSRKSAWYLFGAMCLVTLWHAREIAFVLPSVIGGSWGYSRNDPIEFTLLLLPTFALLLSLFADGRWQRFVKIARTWPNKEIA